MSNLRGLWLGIGFFLLVMGPAIVVVAAHDSSGVGVMTGILLSLGGTFLSAYGLKALIREQLSEVLRPHAQKDETVSQ